MAYDRLYQILETKEGEKEVFKLERAKERRTTNLGDVKCIKDEDGKVPVKEAEIKETWQTYFSKILNGRALEDFWSRERESSERQHDLDFTNVLARMGLKRP